MKRDVLLIILFLIILLIKIKFIFVRKFDSEKWKSGWEKFEIKEKSSNREGSYNYLTPHKKMARWLVRHKKLVGLSKVEIVDLIGLEDNKIESDRWVYWLSFTASDNKWLVVKFNENGIVKDTYIYED
jgi:tRNA G10  N-methylase Trm11